MNDLTNDGFEDFDAPEIEKLPVLKFLTPGEYEDGSPGKADRFKGLITRIGSVFDNTPDPKNPSKDPGQSYPIDLECTNVDMTPLKRAGTQKAYDPPSVGDEVVYFVKVGSPVDKAIQRAAKAVGSNGIDEGGSLYGKFTREKKSKYAQPFKQIDFLYTAPVKPVNDDPWADDGGDGDAPF